MRRALALGAAFVSLAGCGGSARSSSTPRPSPAKPAPSTSTTVPAIHHRARPRPRAHAPFAVGLRIVKFVDHSRTMTFPGAPPQPRALVTLVRYPALGSTERVDAVDAPPARSSGPFPLVIFGHGFAVTPAIYARLLQAWTRAGYVVAAPIFPLENADAPGGPNENDLVNQPRDMSFLISSLLRASSIRGGFFSGLIDERRIAVTGQSDGGETALAVAYDIHFLDRRVRAAVILSGAVIPGVGGFTFPAPSPPLLATQGTADTVNPPSFTHGFFDVAPPPKYLLTLFGASHLGPYTGAQPDLDIVERVTIAFLDGYLNGVRGALRRMVADGDVAGTSSLQADP